MVMTDIKSESGCPSCGKLLDAATGVGNDSGPSPGDFSLCFYCGVFLRFNEDLSLHLMSFTERTSFKFNQPELYNALSGIRKEILQMRKHN